ncbi:MAG: MarR family winged helix-turn-helix transcriptional regulator [Candidatus Merdisoma sp.]|jgi:DNA-binding MarR family transcriptional regulator
MNQLIGVLLLHRRIQKLYDLHMDDIRKSFSLSRIEITIVSFLHNNPGLDTAGDIVEYRMLSKGNVSQSVEALIQKGYLERLPDSEDRRRIHLLLTDQAAEIVRQIDEVKAGFYRTLTEGLSPSEVAQYAALTEKITKNVLNGLESRCNLDEQQQK